MKAKDMKATYSIPPSVPRGFDPFSDRPSRTVRNELAIKLEACIARGEVFGDPPQDLVQQFPQPPYTAYLQDRVERYRSATREMLTTDAGPVAQAAILYRHGLYFESHEILEPYWLATAGRKREGLKGLIQAIGVDVHREAGHAAAAESLARKAVARLRRFGDALGDQQAINIDELLSRLTLMINASGQEEP